MKRQSWGFLAPATTWRNGRVFQSFWVPENNSVVLKSLFCRIVWSEIQSYRKVTCNLVVLTFIKKVPTRIRTRAYWVRSRRLIRWPIEAWLKSEVIFDYLYSKLSIEHGCSRKKGEHITHLHTSDIVTFETDITDT